MKLFKNIIASVSGLFAGISGKSIKDFVVSETQQAVAVLKKTEVGQLVAEEIKIVNSSTLSGPQKFEQVLSKAMPLIKDLVAAGGAKVVLKDVEDIGRALVQEVFNDVMSTKAGTIAKLILSLLKGK